MLRSSNLFIFACFHMLFWFSKKFSNSNVDWLKSYLPSCLHIGLNNHPWFYPPPPNNPRNSLTSETDFLKHITWEFCAHHKLQLSYKFGVNVMWYCGPFFQLYILHLEHFIRDGISANKIQIMPLHSPQQMRVRFVKCINKKSK